MPARGGKTIVVDRQIVLGWREWVALPELGLTSIKAKVDTGARTSALHAFELERFESAGRRKVRFLVHPHQHDERSRVECFADVVDERVVSDSGGHRELRPVIRTVVMVGPRSHSIEITLTDRDTMKFRMLLGRTAMRGQYLVDPVRSYLAGRPDRGAIRARGF